MDNSCLLQLKESAWQSTKSTMIKYNLKILTLFHLKRNSTWLKWNMYNMGVKTLYWYLVIRSKRRKTSSNVWYMKSSISSSFSSRKQPYGKVNFTRLLSFLKTIPRMTKKNFVSLLVDSGTTVMFITIKHYRLIFIFLWLHGLHIPSSWRSKFHSTTKDRPFYQEKQSSTMIFGTYFAQRTNPSPKLSWTISMEYGLRPCTCQL